MRLLMVDTDSCLVSGVTRALAAHGVSLASAPSVERALELVSTERFSSILVESNLISTNELALFGALPVIVAVSFLAPEPARQLSTHARLLRKPFTSAELIHVLAEEVGLCTGDRSLVDVLRDGHASRRSFGLYVPGGELVVENGELVHAAFAERRGESALVAILAGSQSFVLSPAPATPRTIHRPFRALLLDALLHVEALENVERWRRCKGEPRLARRSS